MSKKLIIIDIIITLFIAGGIVWYTKMYRPANQSAAITSFEECSAAGNPILESYPRQCRTQDEQNFVEDLQIIVDIPGQARLTSPQANDVISTPVTVTGEASGWYFEASFPVQVFDANGIRLGQGGAMAQSEWMTTSTVLFKGVIEFTTPTTHTGYLILNPDDPSGERRNKAYLRVPVRFKAVD